MSYCSYPDDDVITVKINEHTLSVEKVVTPHDAPPKIAEWLLSCGWVQQMYDPKTDEPLYIKQAEPATNNMSFRWYEAIAYESFKFMTLADGQNET